MGEGGLYLARWQAPRGGEVVAVPVLHGRVEFAGAVARAFEAVRPTAVAVELPPTLREAVERALARLPRVSVVTYETAGDEAVYWLVEPADPFVEALRRGREANLPLHFVDADIDQPPEHDEPFPDPYAVTRVGHRAYVEACLRERPYPATQADLRRERAMAAGLAAAAGPGERVLFVCGLAHLERVGRMLPGPHAQPLARLRREGVRLFHLSAESLPEVASEIPFVQAVYELRRAGPVAEPDLEGSTVRKRVGALEILTGRARWDEKRALDDAVAWAAARNGPPGRPLDRQRCLYHLVRLAGRHYRQETGETLEPWQVRTLFRYLRNWALLDGRLLPDLYQLVEGARSVADDNFAFAVLRLAGHTPWQKGADDLAAVELSADELRMGSRRIRIRRRLGRTKRRVLRVPRRRKGEKAPGEWLEGFDPQGICSYPPEDEVIEAFGRWLQQKAGRVLSEESARSEPFRGSLLDGIDMRETIRHLPEGEIYVREFRKVPGGVGSVVVIFDEDPDLERHPFTMTWLGEHDQESDMAFYATAPLDNVVGPGICRCEYGGFLLSYPPLRMADVWTDPDYAWTRTPAERLLAAGIDYSEDRFVVYCAPRPPRGFLKQYASWMDRRIVYIPLGTLSPQRLKRLRVVHVLWGKDKRDIAADYIW
ncbi:hypothetical protein [Deferrisoma palaeochoriense]